MYAGTEAPREGIDASRIGFLSRAPSPPAVAAASVRPTAPWRLAAVGVHAALRASIESSEVSGNRCCCRWVIPTEEAIHARLIHYRPLAALDRAFRMWPHAGSHAGSL